jgi:hypothetical protein
MKPISVDAFFSCSFDEKEKATNEAISDIAKALGFNLTNVSTGSHLSPPDVAKEKIRASQALIAVCTHRDEFVSGGYSMPAAVHDEISFAYGADIPILMIVEDGLDLTGFKSNFGTYVKFKRGELNTPQHLEKLLKRSTT